MARQTDVTCDAVGCGLMDSAQGVDWLTVKIGKKKYDLCSEACLRSWIAKRPEQAKLPETDAAPTEISFTKADLPHLRAGAAALRGGA